MSMKVSPSLIEHPQGARMRAVMSQVGSTVQEATEGLLSVVRAAGFVFEGQKLSTGLPWFVKKVKDP